jgi:hypothetical protein
MAMSIITYSLFSTSWPWASWWYPLKGHYSFPLNILPSIKRLFHIHQKNIEVVPQTQLLPLVGQPHNELEVLYTTIPEPLWWARPWFHCPYIFFHINLVGPKISLFYLTTTVVHNHKSSIAQANTSTPSPFQKIKTSA